MEVACVDVRFLSHNELAKQLALVDTGDEIQYGEDQCEDDSAEAVGALMKNPRATAHERNGRGNFRCQFQNKFPRFKPFGMKIPRIQVS